MPATPTSSTRYERINYTPWLSFFVRSLHKQKGLLEAKMAPMEQRQAERLTATSQAILSLVGAQGSWSMADIIAALGQNPETARKAVQSLVRKGYLHKQGHTRGSRYVAASPPRRN